MVGLADPGAEPNMQTEDLKQLRASAVRHLARFHAFTTEAAGVLQDPQSEPVGLGQQKLREVVANTTRWVFWAAAESDTPFRNTAEYMIRMVCQQSISDFAKGSLCEGWSRSSSCAHRIGRALDADHRAREREEVAGVVRSAQDNVLATRHMVQRSGSSSSRQRGWDLQFCAHFERHEYG